MTLVTLRPGKINTNVGASKVLLCDARDGACAYSKTSAPELKAGRKIPSDAQQNRGSPAMYFYDFLLPAFVGFLVGKSGGSLYEYALAWSLAAVICVLAIIALL
ncbi:hypothetical protein [Massilia soli]|uniref:MFS transporter n=1 Tax=Massilia soli TaxID=2792854 RepID=A0ABS7SRH5_9BURK|nr:hypothetical protein [Massilia soli]MBZ2208544.1 hypothetical protein [Massilia soli]